MTFMYKVWKFKSLNIDFGEVRCRSWKFLRKMGPHWKEVFKTEDIDGHYYLSFKHLNRGTKCPFMFSWEVQMQDGPEPCQDVLPLINIMYYRKVLLLAILTVTGSFSLLLSCTRLAPTLLGRMEKGLWRIASSSVLRAPQSQLGIWTQMSKNIMWWMIDAGSRIW